MDNPIYSDLDETLIHNELDHHGNLIRIHPRPGAGEFLKNLSKHGDVYILSHGTVAHVMSALPQIGPGIEAVTGVLAREDLQPVINELERIEEMPIRSREKKRLRAEIAPIVLPGVIFDDQPVGSWLYAIKSIAMGTGPGTWIEVPAYSRPTPKDRALEKAYRKFRKRFVGTSMEGRRR